MDASSSYRTKDGRGSGYDDYIDLLDDLRSSADITYALRRKNFPRYKGVYSLPTNRSPHQLMEDTLKSARVQAAIDAVTIDRKWTREATEKAARMIAAEMGHNFDMKTVRPLAYVAKKVIPQLFSNVYVNRERFLQLKQLSERSAIIFMPSHRTYMDFILLQLLCFHYEINLPAIASAIDFLNMKFMGEALRRCGAFFIRRKFGDDQLYWAIFIEYVENQLKHADRPLEFFIEGTRSRTGKSLHPKYGLLSVLLEPYFRNEVFDFHLVPISVSFSRFLEESLYAYELLGFPKPKESTSGLWKARSVLNIDFGDVYIHAGEPISVRDYFTRLERPLSIESIDHGRKSNIGEDPLTTKHILGGADTSKSIIGDEELVKTINRPGQRNRGRKSIDRSSHALHPSYLFDFTPEEQQEIRRLGHRVVKINEDHAVVRMWPLACVIMSKMLRRSPGLPSSMDIDLSYTDFIRRLERFFDLTLRLKYRIPLKTGSFIDEVKYALNLHSNIIDWRGDRLTLKPVAVSVIDAGSTVIPGKVIDAAVPRLMLSNYANQAMHLFSDLAFVCLSILKNGDRRDRKVIFDDFYFLQSLFSREFISVPGDEAESFDQSIHRLIDAGLLESGSVGTIVAINNSKSEETFSKIYELASIIESFLRGYFLCCEVWIDSRKATSKDEGQEEKRTVVQVQKSISEMLQDGRISIYELLSGDMIKNCLHSLVVLGSAIKAHKSGTKFLILDSETASLKSKLGAFIAALEPAVGELGPGVYAGRRAKL